MDAPTTVLSVRPSDSELCPIRRRRDAYQLDAIQVHTVKLSFHNKERFAQRWKHAVNSQKLPNTNCEGNTVLRKRNTGDWQVAPKNNAPNKSAGRQRPIGVNP